MGHQRHSEQILGQKRKQKEQQSLNPAGPSQMQLDLTNRTSVIVRPEHSQAGRTGDFFEAEPRAGYTGFPG